MRPAGGRSPPARTTRLGQRLGEVVAVGLPRPGHRVFVMDPTRSGAVLARHTGINQTTGQLIEHPDTGEDADQPDRAGLVRGAHGAEGPRRLVISSDFYSVYSSAGRKATGLINLYCWAHVRRHFVRAGDTNPDQLSYWTTAWLERIKNLYLAHEPTQPRVGRQHRRDCRRGRPPNWNKHAQPGTRRWASSTPNAPSGWLRPGCRNPGQEGSGHAGPGMGRAGRPPRLPDDQSGQQRRGARAAPPGRDPQERLRIPQPGRRPARRPRLDRSPPPPKWPG